MSTILIQHITNHATLAAQRLPTQYQGLPKITALVQAFGTRAQTLEDIFYDMIASGSILTGHDSLLDQTGDIVGAARAGLSDADYKLALKAQVSVNVSKAQPETLISIYKQLMQADRVYYNPVYPASFSLAAIGGTPLGAVATIKAALNAARMGGVSIDFIASVPEAAFSFSGDPDPLGQGFGDYNNGATGGYLAQVL